MSSTMQYIKFFLAGLKPCDINTYRAAYNIFGGSICTHPDVLEFLQNELGLKISYYSRFSNGSLEGACYAVNDTLSLQDLRYPFVYDDILLPISKMYRGFLPFKSKRLSPEHNSNFTNVFYTKRLKNKIAYVKKSFSSSTRRKRNGELKRFLHSGGEIISVQSLSPEEIANIYIKLFFDRWGNTLYCWSFEHLYKTLKNFHHMIFGHVLYLNGLPCAIDIIFKSECNEHIYYDDINGGFSPCITEHNLGSILLWSNVCLAFQECKEKNKYCYFSLGMYQKKWEYKKQWCDIVPLGRSIFIF